MKQNLNEVLKVCIGLARKGGICLNVFDLMYETSLPYPELKDIIDKLVLKGELEVIDIKTYKFTGDINRNFEEAEARKSDTPISDKSPRRADPFAERRAYLEERRQELIARMQARMEKDDGDDGETDNVTVPDNNDEGEDEEPDNKFAEYEKYLKSRLEGEDDEEEDDGGNWTDYEDEAIQAKELENEQHEDTVGFLKAFMMDARATKPWEEIPEHPSWDSEDDFMRLCGEKFMTIVKSDVRMGRSVAVKKADLLLDDALKTRNKKMIEVYECVVFVLQNMSNYYYIKMRNLLT